MRQLKRLRSAKFLVQIGGYHLLPIQPHTAVNDPMSNGLELPSAGPFRDPVDEAVGCLTMIGRTDRGAMPFAREMSVAASVVSAVRFHQSARSERVAAQGST